MVAHLEISLYDANGKWHQVNNNFINIIESKSLVAAACVTRESPAQLVLLE
jgi:hypothetical protein